MGDPIEFTRNYSDLSNQHGFQLSSIVIFKVKHCTECGAKLDAGAKFCGECGTKAAG